MELVFVRHALPARAEPVDGPADPELVARGHEQAARVGAFLAGEPLDAVYVSPMRRALQTAAPLLSALGQSGRVRDGLAEFDVAGSSYVPVEELRAANDPRWQRLVAGELYDSAVDVAAFRARVVAAVDAIVAAHPGGRVALVSHAGVINAYTGQVLGISRPIWFAPAYVSITRVRADRAGRRGLASLNETGHVRDLL